MELDGRRVIGQRRSSSPFCAQGRGAVPEGDRPPRGQARSPRRSRRSRDRPRPPRAGRRPGCYRGRRGPGRGRSPRRSRRWPPGLPVDMPGDPAADVSVDIARVALDRRREHGDRPREGDDLGSPDPSPSRARPEPEPRPADLLHRQDGAGVQCAEVVRADPQLRGRVWVKTRVPISGSPLRRVPPTRPRVCQKDCRHDPAFSRACRTSSRGLQCPSHDPCLLHIADSTSMWSSSTDSGLRDGTSGGPMIR